VRFFVGVGGARPPPTNTKKTWLPDENEKKRGDFPAPQKILAKYSKKTIESQILERTSPVTLLEIF
jgi:hypothetical protein